MSLPSSPQSQATKTPPAKTASPADWLLQRTCSCGSSTSSLSGECVECDKKKLLQTKLAVGTVHGAGRGHRHHFIGDEGDRETEGSVA